MDETDLEFEKEIVWEEDVRKLPYVRQTLVVTHTRGRPPHRLGQRRVGYAVLRADAPSVRRRRFERRVFWLASHDAPNDGPYKNGGAPCEAVDPTTVAPGKLGVMTYERARNGRAS